MGVRRAELPNDIIAEVSCSVSLLQDNTLRILGTKGRIEVKDFWFASGKEGGTGEIVIIRPDGTSEVVTVKEDNWLYAFEVDAAGDAILAGKTEMAAPGMSWADSIGNLKVLDKWRLDAGLEYGIEKADRRINTISGRKLGRQWHGHSQEAGARHFPADLGCRAGL